MVSSACLSSDIPVQHCPPGTLGTSIQSFLPPHAKMPLDVPPDTLRGIIALLVLYVSAAGVAVICLRSLALFFDFVKEFV